jgi:hypothetical protein
VLDAEVSGDGVAAFVGHGRSGCMFNRSSEPTLLRPMPLQARA